MIKPVDGTLVLVLRATASAEIRQQLIDAGLLVVDNGTLTIARLPEAAEVALVRDLIGLRRLAEAK